MKIALDYDDTWTADADLWRAFVALARNRGHEVMIVTRRGPIHGNALPDKIEGMRVINTSSQPKEAFLRAMGIKIDWWIDDSPWCIVETDAQREANEILSRAPRAS